MRCAILLTAAVCLFCPPLAQAQRKPVGPLEICHVRASLDDGKVTLELHIVKYLTEQRAYVIEKDGKKTVETRTVQVPVFTPVQLPVDGKDVRVFDLEGNQVDPQELPKRLGMNGAMVLSPTGKVPLQFQQILRDQTLVLSITGEAAKLLAK